MTDPKTASSPAPQMIVADAHGHRGARAVINHATQDLECAFCGVNVGFVRVSEPLLDPRFFGVFDALQEPLTSFWLAKLGERCAKLAAITSAAKVGSIWKNESLSSRKPKEVAKAEVPSPSPAERAEEEVFAKVLSAGEGWLDAIKEEIAAPGPHAAVAVGMLSLRTRCPSGWHFNPALAVDPRAVDAFDAFAAGRASSFSARFEDREGERLDLLLAAWEHSRPELQDAAVIALTGGRQGFGAPPDQAARWKSASAAQIQRALTL
ncbi:MAG: hypothetical protein L6Q76_36080, partial [Polyangiaceae bacterium]|nr:hypothetical protein [Polyangiaceae bacterium]